MIGEYGKDFGGYFTQLPPHVRHCHELTPMARILYSEISALCNFKGFCWAKNSYFAELYQTDERTIQVWLSKLVDQKFINVELIQTEKGTRRSITILEFTKITTGGDDGKIVRGGDGNLTLNRKGYNKETIIKNNEDDSDQIVAKSKLVKKKSLPIEIKEPIRPCFTDKNGNALPERREHFDRDTHISDKVMECIHYWNSKPELVTHKVDPENPTLTVKYCIKYLNSFFHGTLREKAMLPNDFDNRDWDEKKHSLADFQYFVDELCYCISKPNLLPKNDRKISLIEFLYGNERFNLPSALFNYCVGDYKTALENKYPKTVELIKNYWEEVIGKFEDNAENETAFVIVSNLINQTFTKRRNDNKGWIPSMGSYAPMGILKNIIQKNMWIKEKKHTPEYMATKFFKRMVERYNYDPKTGQITF